MPKAGWKERQISFECEVCRVRFSVRPSRAAVQRSRVRFCSTACHSASKQKRHTFECAKCGEKKGPNDFFRDNTKARGHVARCKSCYKVARRTKIEAKAKTPPSEACDICGEREPRLAFDHCHATGKFRGWLCGRCNLTLGKVKDNTALLRKMIGYLERH
jgi:hypothetical protein